MGDAGFNGLGIFKQLLRDDIVRTARGFIAETIDVRWAASSAVTGSGVANYTALCLLAGEKISNLTFMLTSTPAVGVTLSKVGLYSKTGVLLAISADQGTSWQTIGVKTVSLLSPYIVSVTDVYYVAWLCVVTTTAPALLRGSGGNVTVSFALGSNLAAYYGQSGLADLPNQATFATGITTSQCFWCGLS